MRFGFSFAATSASTLAMATAAGLALPLSAHAADFVYRNDERIATSLEMPDDGANLIIDSGRAEQVGLTNDTGAVAGFTKSGAGELILSGESTIGADSQVNAGRLTVTGTLNTSGSTRLTVNNATLDVSSNGSVGNLSNSSDGTVNNYGQINTIDNSGITNNNANINTLSNAGTVINQGQIQAASVLVGASLVNKKRASVRNTTSSGTVVNEGGMYGLTQNAGSFANNKDASIYGLSQNGGVVTNNGSMVHANVAQGALTNNASGTIVYGTVNDGTFANSGKISSATIEAPGTMTNNATGEMIEARVNGGVLSNGGKIKTANVKANGTLTNNKDGIIDVLENEGITANSGLIGKATAILGSLTNSSTGTFGNLMQKAGVTTNNGKITVTTIETGTITNNGLGTIGNATVKAGALVNNGKVDTATIEAGSTLTNNQNGVISILNNAGAVTNAGQLGQVSQTAGTLTNNGTISGEASISAGQLTNNNAIELLTVSASGGFVNNKNGKVNTLTQTGGKTTSSGAIENASVSGGILTNNATGTLGQINLAAGTLNNSGSVTDVKVGKVGAFTNKATGKAGKVTHSGQGSNEGIIGNLQVDDGNFQNTGIVTENLQVNGGSLTSSGLIGGKLSIDGTSANLATANLSGAINGGIDVGVNGVLNMRGDLTGNGGIINNGLMTAPTNSKISGFSNFENNGSLVVGGNLAISGDMVSAGKIELAGDASQFQNLSVGGKLTLTEKSVTSVNLADDGSSDVLSAGGDLTLNGTLNVAATGENYSLKSTYGMFKSSAGKVAGRFADVVVSGTKDLFGIAEDSAAGLVLAIRNRGALNKQLQTETLGDDAKFFADIEYKGKDGAELFDTFAILKKEDAQGLVSQIMGVASSAVINAGGNAAKSFGNLLQKVATASGLQRSDDGVLAYEQAMAAEQNNKFLPVLQEGQGAVNLWGRGFGEAGSNKAGGDAMIGGLAAGADMALGNHFTIGASGGYSMARFGHGTNIEGKTNTIHAGTYLGFGATAPEATGFGLTATGSFAKHETSTKRTFKIGALTKIADAKYAGTTLAGEVMVRHGITMGDKIPLTIAPIAGVKFSFDNDEGYTETGAGVLNLKVSGAKRRSVAGVVGLQVASRIETENIVFTPHVSAVYQHEFLDTSSTTTRTLGASTTPFTLKKGGGSRSAVALEAGLGLRFAGGLAMDVSGYGVFSGDETRYGAKATVKAGF